MIICIGSFSPNITSQTACFCTDRLDRFKAGWQRLRLTYWSGADLFISAHTGGKMTHIYTSQTCKNKPKELIIWWIISSRCASWAFQTNQTFLGYLISKSSSHFHSNCAFNILNITFIPVLENCSHLDDHLLTTVAWLIFFNNDFSWLSIAINRHVVEISRAP